jgi:hypothetical protein
MKRLLYIERLALAVILLLLLALAPAKAQTPVRTGDTTPLAVDSLPNDSYEWSLYSNGTIDFATAPANCPVTSAFFVGGNIGATVNVKWLKAGIYFYKVTAHNASGCSMNLKIGTIEIKVGVTAIITPPTKAVCAGDPVLLEITFTGTAPWSFTYTDGTTERTVNGVNANPYTLIVNPVPLVTTNYTVKSVSDINGTIRNQAKWKLK